MGFTMPVRFPVRSMMHVASCVSIIFVGTIAAEDEAKWNKEPAERLLPTVSNAVTVVRMEQLLNTPWARAGEESADLQRRYERGEAVIPPWVSSATIAALIRPAKQGAAFRSIVAQLVSDAPVSDVNGSGLPNMPEMRQLATERDALFFANSDGRVLGWSPASEPEFKHWLAGAFTQGLSTPLSAVIEDPEPEAIVAIDLTGLVDKEAAKRRLQSESQFDGLVERGVALLTDVSVVSCAVNVTNRLECTVRIVSGGGVAYLEQDVDLVRTLFLAILDDTGYSLPEMHSFNAVLEGDAVILSGVLHDDSLVALTSLGVPPLPGSEVVVAQKEDPKQVRNAKQPTPLEDFNRAVAMIESLDRRQKRAKSPGSVANWCDRTADDLDELSISTSDRTVSGFASRSAASLRAMGSSLRGLKTDLDAEQATLTYNVNRDPGWASVSVWGAVGVREPSVHVDTNLRQVRERQARIAKESASEREQVWSQIQADIASTRRELSKIGIE